MISIRDIEVVALAFTFVTALVARPIIEEWKKTRKESHKVLQERIEQGRDLWHVNCPLIKQREGEERTVGFCQEDKKMHPRFVKALHMMVSVVIACVLSTALVLAAPGDLLVSDYSSDNIRLFDGQNGTDLGEFVSAGSGGLNGTWDATFGPQGLLYVASSVTGSILQYDGTTGEFLGVFAAGSGLSGPVGAVFGPDGNLYVSGSSNEEIRRYDGTNGEFIDVFTSGVMLNVPRALVFGPDGNLYVTHFDNNVVRYDGQTGAFIDFFVSTASGGLDAPGDLAFGPDGDLYVASRDSDRILRYDGMTGQYRDVFAVAEDPIGLTFGPDGHLYVTHLTPGAGRVSRYDGQTGAFVDLFATGLAAPTFLTFVPESEPGGDPEGEGEGEGEKVCICHVPRGNPRNAHTICVAESAVAAHLAHGDDPQPCSQEK